MPNFSAETSAEFVTLKPYPSESYTRLFLPAEQPSPGETHPFASEVRSLIQNPPPPLHVLPPTCLPPPGPGRQGLEPPSQEMVSACGCQAGEVTWVETREQLQAVVRVLEGEHEFAVDTEQHSRRSFLGFTALLQVRGWLKVP